MTAPLIDIVSATRRPEAGFWDDSPLAISLRRIAFDTRLAAHVSFANQRGLPEVYNARLAAADCAEYVVFVHDDVWLDDHYIADRIIEGLRVYEVIGVAGNRRRVAGQPAWAFVDDTFTWDHRDNLSGAVAHARRPFGAVSYFGPAPAACELLDGVFLAARASVLRSRGVAFDPRFAFHFYDLDFCRTARERGLRLGTWPIALTHESGGVLGSPAWRAAYRVYRAKWGE
jgi:GT2 family glycosyltransferase